MEYASDQFETDHEGHGRRVKQRSPASSVSGSVVGAVKRGSGHPASRLLGVNLFDSHGDASIVSLELEPSSMCSRSKFSTSTFNPKPHNSRTVLVKQESMLI